MDRHVAPVAHKVKPVQLDRVINEAIGRFMPDEVERLAAASWDKRHVTLYDQLVSFTGTMHLDAELDIADALDLDAAVAAGAAQRAALGSTESLDVRRAQAVGDLARDQLALDLDHRPNATRLDGRSRRAGRSRDRWSSTSTSPRPPSPDSSVDPVARLERGDALVTADQVRTWCGHPDAQVVVKPVIDLDDRVARPTPTTCRTASPSTSSVRDRTCVFPWCTRPPRSLRHATTSSPARPRRTTCTCNIAPLCRTPPPAEDPHPVDLHRPRPRHLPVDQPPRLPVPPRPHRHPRRHPRPTPDAGRTTRPLTTPPHTRPPPAGRSACQSPESHSSHACRRAVHRCLPRESVASVWGCAGHT